MVRIRLSRQGRPHAPFYRISAIEKQVKRDGRVLENLGWYDPKAKDASKRVFLEVEKIKNWISRGAQPSDTVNDLLAKENLIDAEAWKAHRAARATAKQAATAKAAAATAAAAAGGEKKA